MRKSILVTMLLLLSFLSVGVMLLPDVKGATRFVGGGGPGNYTTIQEAIDASNPGDFIYVYSGVYDENIEVSRTLTLTGEDRNTTVVDGGGAGDVVRISSDWVNVTGFTLQGADTGLALSHVQHVKIAQNAFQNNQQGVSLYESHNNTIVGNIFSDNWEGIAISTSDDNIIEGNPIINHFRGIEILSSRRDVVRDNAMIGSSITIGGNEIGHWNTHVIEDSNTVNGKPVYYWKNVTGGTVPTGAGEVILANCTSVTVENQSVHNGTVGILIGRSTDIEIVNNNISANVSGIATYYSAGNRVRANEISDSGSGVRMYFSNDTQILELNATGNGYGIFFWHCMNNTIKNGTFEANSDGINLHYSMDNTIIDNSVTSSVQVGIYLTLGSDRNTLTGNTITHNTRPGIQVDYSNSNGLRNNTISSNAGLGIYVYESSANTFHSNDILANGANGLFLDNSDSNFITDNTILGNYFGVNLWFSSLNIVNENNISDNNETGIDVTFSGKTRIVDNRLMGNTNAIILDEAENTTVHGNNVSWNSGVGIHVDGVPCGSVISDNTFTHNAEGIVFRYPTYSTVSNNTIAWNSHHGIYLYGSHWNAIKENGVLENGVGINLTSSSNNTIFHNSIVNNTKQAHDDQDSNLWDDGYPSGGNYWSDYTGIDDCSGPNQNNCPDPDGIGDTPYAIDPNSRDRYPLMWPFAEMFPQPPTLISAELTGTDLENVTLTWLLSPDEGNTQKPVVEYSIYRSMSYDQRGIGYALVASVPNGTSMFTDSLVGEGDPNSYFYLVCAVDSFNYTSCSDVQAGKMARPLSRGPNLLSLPFTQADPDIITVLNMVKYDKAWSYNAFSGKWKWRMRFKDYEGSLTRIEHTMGVWVNITNDCNLTVAGIVPAQTMIQLYAGWNLVSFPSVNASYAVADLKADTGATRVEGYDPTPPYFLRVLGDAEMLQAGYGHWVKVDADALWTVSFA